MTDVTVEIERDVEGLELMLEKENMVSVGLDCAGQSRLLVDGNAELLHLVAVVVPEDESGGLSETDALEASGNDTVNRSLGVLTIVGADTVVVAVDIGIVMVVVGPLSCLEETMVNICEVIRDVDVTIGPVRTSLVRLVGMFIDGAVVWSPGAVLAVVVITLDKAVDRADENPEGKVIMTVVEVEVSVTTDPPGTVVVISTTTTVELDNGPAPGCMIVVERGVGNIGRGRVPLEELGRSGLFVGVVVDERVLAKRLVAEDPLSVVTELSGTAGDGQGR